MDTIKRMDKPVIPAHLAPAKNDLRHAPNMVLRLLRALHIEFTTR